MNSKADMNSVLARMQGQKGIIRPNATVSEAFDRMRAETVTNLIVSEDGATVMGAIWFDDIKNARRDRGHGVLEEQIKGLISTRKISCSFDDDASTALALVPENTAAYIAVTNKAGLLCTVLTRDILRALKSILEEEAERTRKPENGIDSIKEVEKMAKELLDIDVIKET